LGWAEDNVFHTYRLVQFSGSTIDYRLSAECGVWLLALWLAGDTLRSFAPEKKQWTTAYCEQC